MDLPAPVSPTSATVSPGCDVEVDAVQGLASGARVREVHVVEADRAARARPGSTGCVGVGRGHRRLHELVDLGHRRHRLLPLVEHLRELLDRREELVEVEQERDHGAGGDGAVVHERAAEPEHDRVAARGEEQDEREVERLEPLRREPGVEVASRGRRGTSRCSRSSRTYACATRTPEMLSWNSALTVEIVSRACAYARAERRRNHTVRDDQRRHEHEHAEGERPAEQAEHDQHADEAQDVDERGDEAGLQQLRERVDVGGHAGHDPARHLAVVVVEREPLQVGEDPDAQREEQPFRGAAGVRACRPR